MAEATGLIIPLGELVLDQAVETVARWNRETAGPPLSVSVNLAARQLVIPDLVPTVDAVLVRHGLDRSLLTLEITETAIMEDVTEGVAVLNHLKSLGLKLAIDDFGTGYSSMAYLQQLPIDVLKIDRSFISGMGSRPVDASIVRAIVGLADATGRAVPGRGGRDRGPAVLPGGAGVCARAGLPLGTADDARRRRGLGRHPGPVRPA